MFRSPAIRPLADSELPSTVRAIAPWQGVSNRYAFVNTMDIVHALAEVGLRPYMAKVSHARLETKIGYTKHMLRFRQEGGLSIPGGIYPEVWIINSHDTGAAFQGGLGLYRLICKNGLVANYGTMSAFRGIHVALGLSEVVEGVQRIIGQFPRLAEDVQAMQTTQLGQTQREAFANAALALRWDSDKAPLEAIQLLATRRPEDVQPTVWNVYNTIQENLLTGQAYRVSRDWRRVTRHTRAINSIDVDMKLNGGLWEMASRFAHATA
jgi:Domain of unknown function (DUF932)